MKESRRTKVLLRSKRRKESGRKTTCVSFFRTLSLRSSGSLREQRLTHNLRQITHSDPRGHSEFHFLSRIFLSAFCETDFSTLRQFLVSKRVLRQVEVFIKTDGGFALTVYEFRIGNTGTNKVLVDRETSFVYITGVLKALGKVKAEITRLIENQPEIDSVLRKIRGGASAVQVRLDPLSKPRGGSLTC